MHEVQKKRKVMTEKPHMEKRNTLYRKIDREELFIEITASEKKRVRQHGVSYSQKFIKTTEKYDLENVVEEKVLHRKETQNGERTDRRIDRMK